MACVFYPKYFYFDGERKNPALEITLFQIARQLQWCSVSATPTSPPLQTPPSASSSLSEHNATICLEQRASSATNRGALSKGGTSSAPETRQPGLRARFCKWPSVWLRGSLCLHGPKFLRGLDKNQSFSDWVGGGGTVDTWGLQVLWDFKLFVFFILMIFKLSI